MAISRRTPNTTPRANSRASSKAASARSNRSSRRPRSSIPPPRLRATKIESPSVRPWISKPRKTARPSATRSLARTRRTSSRAASPSPRRSRARWSARPPATWWKWPRRAANTATRSSTSDIFEIFGGGGMKRFSWLASVCLALCASPQGFAQDWIPLQDGKSLAGWKAPERPESWVVEDGAFVTHGERSHLFYVGKVGKHDFKNFEFSAEVMTSPGANSGIYVHTRLQPDGWPAAGYELQVINSNPPAEKTGGYIEHKMTGSIYAVRNTWVASAKDNEWFNYRIRVEIGRAHV